MNPQTLDLDTLRAAARLAGFAWSDAELEAIRPAAEAAARLLATLETVQAADREPTIQYRAI